MPHISSHSIPLYTETDTTYLPPIIKGWTQQKTRTTMPGGLVEEDHELRCKYLK